MKETLLLSLIFATLITWILTFALVYGRPGQIFRHHADKYEFFKELLECPICTGTWVAFIVTIVSIPVLFYCDITVLGIVIFFLPSWLATAGLNGIVFVVTILRNEEIGRDKDDARE